MLRSRSTDPIWRMPKHPSRGRLQSYSTTYTLLLVVSSALCEVSRLCRQNSEDGADYALQQDSSRRWPRHGGRLSPSRNALSPLCHDQRPSQHVFGFCKNSVMTSSRLRYLVSSNGSRCRDSRKRARASQGLPTVFPSDVEPTLTTLLLADHSRQSSSLSFKIRSLRPRDISLRSGRCSPLDLLCPTVRCLRFIC